MNFLYIDENQKGTSSKQESKPKEMVQTRSRGQVQSTSQVPSDDRLTTAVSTDKAPQKHHSKEDERVNELQGIKILLIDMHHRRNHFEEDMTYLYQKMT